MSSLSSGTSTGNVIYTNGPLTSGAGIYIGNGTTSSGSVVINQPGGVFSAGATISSAFWGAKALAYYVLRLPIKKIPYMVYVNGEAVTLGILGSNAECVFGQGSLIFDASCFSISLFKPRSTIILEYKTKTYHYCVNDVNGRLTSENSNILNAELLSVVKKG